MALSDNPHASFGQCDRHPDPNRDQGGYKSQTDPNRRVVPNRVHTIGPFNGTSLLKKAAQRGRREVRATRRTSVYVEWTARPRTKLTDFFSRLAVAIVVPGERRVRIAAHFPVALTIVFQK